MKMLATVLIVLLLLLQIQLWLGSHGVFQLSYLRNSIGQAREENQALVERNEQLHSKVIELKEGQEALEEKARSDLGFIKDGEVFYRIIPESKSTK